LNAWTSIYESRYVYHGTWAHLSCVLHKFLPSVCVYVYRSVVTMSKGVIRLAKQNFKLPGKVGTSSHVLLRNLANSVAWVRERTIPTERPPLVGEVNANFCGWRVPRGQGDGSLRPYSRLSIAGYEP
jgi:hypothetical protein